MTIRFQCTKCDKRLKVADRFAGAAVKCPKCKHPLVIPDTREHIPLPVPSSSDDSDIIDVRRKDSGPEELMDMTPMVDVVFLLLIFFMVTAAFALQKSIEVPPPDTTDSVSQTRTIEDLEEDDDFVIIRIDGDNTIWVDGSEAPSSQEMLSMLRRARDGDGAGGGPSSLLVTADPDARYELVIMALDAGTAVGMDSVRLGNSSEDSL